MAIWWLLVKMTHFCVAYQVPHAVAGDGTHAVATKAPHAVAADGTHAVAGDGSDVVAADGTHAVAGDGSHAVTADRRARTCAVAAARRARRRGPGPPRTAPHIPHTGGETTKFQRALPRLSRSPLEY
jgi:hypothetical protein